MVDQEFFTLAKDSLKIIDEKHNSDHKPPFLIVIKDKTNDPVSLYTMQSVKELLIMKLFFKLGILILLGSLQRMNGKALFWGILQTLHPIQRVWFFIIEEFINALYNCLCSTLFDHCLYILNLEKYL
ncbi:hypothetical protein J5N97_018308 [Dioscorea zingiberensis]|uniref:Uncharacterized protein n=1 Tax=Dioscorea zingiberensis TaxID=325984 RepID=A0A9D5CPU4_9LILI|nr:hypothetical protein J5N97_018308 [Dioscorea zingiberensis]